jgi:hypothetical protein
VHTALGLAREDVERSGHPIPSMPRGTRLQAKRRPLRRTAPAGRVARPLPPLRRRAAAPTFWQRFGNDRDLVAVKISLLVGMAILTAALEWLR